MQTILPSDMNQGISVEEGITQQQAIIGAENRPTAFVGYCLRGPTDHPVLIKSVSGFERIFGPLSHSSTLSYAVKLFFLNGGRRACVVRVAHDAKPACIELLTDKEFLVLHSRHVGGHDHLRVAIDYDGIDQADHDCFNIVIQRLAAPATEDVIDQEIFRYVSVSPDHPNFITRVLAGSRLMRVSDEVPSARPRATLNYASGKAAFFQQITRAGYDGARITMADVLGSSDKRTGIFALTNQYDFSQLYIPPLTFEMDLGVPVLRVAARMCERRNATLIVDTPKAWLDQNVALKMIDRYSLRGNNVAMYFPWIEVVDPLNDGLLRIPPGGSVAGVLDRCMSEFGPGGTPAGQRTTLRGVQRFAETISETEGYRLAQKGINSLRRAKGGRKVIWDAVLLSHNDGSHVHIHSLKVRRLLQYVASSINQGLQWTAFEPNNEKLWKKVHDQVYNFLQHGMNRGLFRGAVPDNSFSVRCDLQTNPSSLRKQHKLGVEIEVAPIQPSRFVKLCFELPTSGNQQHG